MSTDKTSISLGLAQLNLAVGDIAGNSEKIVALANRAKSEFGLDILALPEQAIIGYPAQDLLLQAEILAMCREAVDKIISKIPPDLCLILGYPRATGSIDAGGKPATNHLEVCLGGKSIASYAKQILPSYQVFDEQRYFAPGPAKQEGMMFELKGMKFSVLICEDLWQDGPAAACAKQGADHIISINASPYSVLQPAKRQEVVRRLAKSNGVSISYVNGCGGQDELVFDGYSFFCDAGGEIAHTAPPLQENLSVLRLDSDGKLAEAKDIPLEDERRSDKSPKLPLAKTAEVYEVLKHSIYEYAHKNGFGHCVLGLSGGIDSALIACLASDALGPHKVTALMMPHKWTADISVKDAEALAQNLGINYESRAINELVAATHACLSPMLDLSDPHDIATQNIQPRLRALILMALANKKQALLLAASNKSESAVGYTTLYGDMAGGFAPLKDVFKTRVYELAVYRNSVGKTPVIPERIIKRPPTAELYEGQQDDSKLPGYDVLDEILHLYIERRCEKAGILAANSKFSAELVTEVMNMVDRAEFKRRQSAPGPRISEHGFGKDRRYPITNKFVKSR